MGTSTNNLNAAAAGAAARSRTGSPPPWRPVTEADGHGPTVPAARAPACPGGRPGASDGLDDSSCRDLWPGNKSVTVPAGPHWQCHALAAVALAVSRTGTPRPRRPDGRRRRPAPGPPRWPTRRCRLRVTSPPGRPGGPGDPAGVRQSVWSAATAAALNQCLAALATGLGMTHPPLSGGGGSPPAAAAP